MLNVKWIHSGNKYESLYVKYICLFIKLPCNVNSRRMNSAAADCVIQK